MNNQDFIKRLQKLGACKEAVQWVGTRDSNQVFADCHRGDWLLWWFCMETKFGTIGFPYIKQITKAKVECAKLIVHLMKDERSKTALNVAWDWAHGKASYEEFEHARRDAHAAAYTGVFHQ